MKLIALSLLITTLALAGCGGTTLYGHPYIPDPIDPASVPEAWATAPLPGNIRAVLKPVGVRLLEPNLLIVDALFVSRRWDTIAQQARVARYIYNGEVWGAMDGKGVALEMCDGDRLEVLPIDISSPSKYSRSGQYLFKTLETDTPSRMYTVFPLVYRTAQPLEVGQCVTVRMRRVGEHRVEPDTDPVTFTIAPYHGNGGEMK